MIPQYRGYTIHLYETWKLLKKEEFLALLNTSGTITIDGHEGLIYEIVQTGESCNGVFKCKVVLEVGRSG